VAAFAERLYCLPSGAPCRQGSRASALKVKVGPAFPIPWTAAGAPIDLAGTWPADRVRALPEVSMECAQQTVWPGSAWIDTVGAPAAVQGVNYGLLTRGVADAMLGRPAWLLLPAGMGMGRLIMGSLC
jgi:hypothetical protein